MGPRHRARKYASRLIASERSLAAALMNRNPFTAPLFVRAKKWSGEIFAIVCCTVLKELACTPYAGIRAINPMLGSTFADANLGDVGDSVLDTSRQSEIIHIGSRRCCILESQCSMFAFHSPEKVLGLLLPRHNRMTPA